MCIIAKNNNFYKILYVYYIIYIIKNTSCNIMCIHLMNRIQQKLAQFNEYNYANVIFYDPLLSISIHREAVIV